MQYKKTIYITTDTRTQHAQFAALRIGQWVTGISLNNVSGFYRGQFLGFDNAGYPIINDRKDNAKTPLDWAMQFKSNAPLRAYAKIKAGV